MDGSVQSRDVGPSGIDFQLRIDSAIVPERQINLALPALVAHLIHHNRVSPSG